VLQKDNEITFSSKINKQTGGQLFNIKIWTKEKWNADSEELIKLIHISKVGEREDTVFTFDTPTDVQYNAEDQTKKAEYLSMSNDIDVIKTSFRLK
jgi:hypothetical protein